MSAPSGRLASSQPSSWVSTTRRTSGSPSSGTGSGLRSPVAVTWIFHQPPMRSAETLRESPSSQSRTRVKASTITGSEPRTTASAPTLFEAVGMARLRTAPRTTPRALSFGSTAAASRPAARRPTSCACSNSPSSISGRPKAAWRADSCRASTEERSLCPSRPHPDPAAERTLDHQAAQVETKTQPALGAAASRGPRLLEHRLQRRRGQALAVVRDGHLEPTALHLARLDLHRPGRVLEGVADQVRQHLGEVGRLAERGRQVVRQVDLHRRGALGVAVVEHGEDACQRALELERLGRRLEVARLELGDDQLALDQAEQPV